MGSPPYQATIRMSEHQHRSVLLAELPASADVEDVFELLDPAVRARLIAFGMQFDSSGRAFATLKTSGVVGFTRLEDRMGQAVFVGVDPKVPTDRMLELAAEAGLLPSWHPPDTWQVTSASSALLEWTLRAFDESLVHITRKGGFRPLHIRTREVLRNRLRGRLIVGDYVRSVSRGRPDQLPCEFPALEVDNHVNRFLRWAARLAQAAARSLPTTIDVAGSLRRIDEMLAPVTIKPFRPGQGVKASALPPSLRHYRRAVDLANFLVDAVNIDAAPGQAPAISVAIDMANIYERAFFRVLRDLVPQARGQVTWPIRVATHGSVQDDQRETRMKPDVFVPSSPGRLPIVIDTKWKETFSDPSSEDVVLSEAETKTIRLRTSDLYQIIAYGIEALRSYSDPTDSGCVAALIYPALGSTPDLTFRTGGASASIDVRLVGWDVTTNVRQGVADVWRRLEEAAGPPTNLAKSSDMRR